jgi:membrane protein implicated in regulation of membrane protease activity
VNAVVLMSEGQAIALQYPESALPAVQLAIMAVVVTAVLAMWLILVFLAAREPRGKAGAADREHRDKETAATVTGLPLVAGPEEGQRPT